MAETVASRSAKREVASEGGGPARERISQATGGAEARLLNLQRAIGNRAVSRFLASQLGNRTDGNCPPNVSSGASHVIQTKLAVSQPGDRYEQEADSVAEQVMRMREPGASSDLLTTEPCSVAQLQRKCVGCEEEESQAEPEGKEAGGVRPIDIDMPLPGKTLEEETLPPVPMAAPGILLQRMCAAGEKTDLSSRETETGDKRAEVHDFHGGGEPLRPSAREFFEPRFGYTFDQVRVHSDTRATESARAVNALAYTRGHDIVFAAGQYAPETVAGRRLLAHELTHVMQQNPAHTSTKFSGPPKGSVSVQVMKSRSTTLQRKVVTGDPISGINTIVCDGAGGINVQLSGKEDAIHAECLNDCMTKHEETHKADALADNARICEGQGANRIVTWDTQAERSATEIKSSNAEITCLKAKAETAKCKTIIKDRIKQMETYRDSFK